MFDVRERSDRRLGKGELEAAGMLNVEQGTPEGEGSEK